MHTSQDDAGDNYSNKSIQYNYQSTLKLKMTQYAIKCWDNWCLGNQCSTTNNNTWPTGQPDLFEYCCYCNWGPTKVS